ncbi:uncharacterized protein si:ch211-191i18.2 [Phycodurus eques]|uniref:uncharacterized protein si:ch211-191i18.2 n=1 Tax=Phycodurus eques TaxID=693459 RepID=UPI002ACE5EB0|nr:uncharacterized protein si:ch211-191i18.2 [Phycodurus eques]
MHATSQCSMSSSCVSALTLVLFITTGCEAEVTTSSPDYEYDDYNSTLRYSFFSNTSSDDLEKFLKDRKHLLDSQEDQDEDWDQDQYEDQVDVTTATQQERGGVTMRNASTSTFICSGMMMMMMMMVAMETHT